MDLMVQRTAGSKSDHTIHRTERRAVQLLPFAIGGVVARARALLVGLEGMTGHIVGRLLKAEPGCQVVAELPARDGLLDAIRDHQPTLVVIGLQDAEVGPGWDRLFVEHPEIQVLAVTPEGRRACLFREPLVEGLLAVLREP